jgi:hypothetical protein
LSPIGGFAWGYWSTDAINKFEWYRHLSQENLVPKVVAVGDSTGARNFYPKYFTDSAGVSSYNLAWPSNFPLAFHATTLPLMENDARPLHVLLFQIPFSFIDNAKIARFENSILSSPIAQKYIKKYLISDYIYLSRITKARLLLKRYWIDKKKIISEWHAYWLSTEQNCINCVDGLHSRLNHCMRWQKMILNAKKRKNSVGDSIALVIV